MLKAKRIDIKMKTITNVSGHGDGKPCFFFVRRRLDFNFLVGDGFGLVQGRC